MEEIFLDKQKLISKEEWESRISKLYQQNISNNSSIVPILTQKRLWKNAFETAILNRVKSSKGKIGVLFSGGVDSTIIAHILHKNKIPFTCFTIAYQDVGTKTPEDLEEANNIAKEYNWKIIAHIATTAETESIIKKTIKILGKESTPVSVGVGAVVVAGCELALQHNVRTLFTGLGSEEIFGGYRRHIRSMNKTNKKDSKESISQDKITKKMAESLLHEECWRGLTRMYERDLIRDTDICSAYKITAWTPFLDPQVISIAMNIPAKEKIKDGHTKYVLRAMAQELGMSNKNAFRPKRAAQYGSRYDSAFDKLAKDKKCDYIAKVLESQSKK